MGNQRLGRTCIRVFPDYGVEFPLWGAPPPNSSRDTEYHIGPYLPEDLPPLSAWLYLDLCDWSKWWTQSIAEEMGEAEPSARSSIQELQRQEYLWKEQGRQLCRRLQEELGESYTVIYDVH